MFKLTPNRKPITIAEFVKGIGKFKKLTETEIASIQSLVDARWALLNKLAAE